jgi:transcriptional regulator with XRE-family HTH domain
VKSILSARPATPETSFRLRLQSELARRCARNAQYSLRAFALHLAVDHSTLSQWLRGRRPITARAIEEIGGRLGLSEDAIRRYVENAGRGIPEPEGLLSGETAALIADWHHFAILEITRLAEFRADSRWIARVLDLSVDEVNLALQRLIRLDLLEMAAPDRWVDKSGDAVVHLPLLDEKTRERRDGQARRLSTAARDGVSPALREHTTVTLAISRARIPRAIEVASRLMQQLIEELQSGEADDVYQVDFAMYPVTTLNREEEHEP